MIKYTRPLVVQIPVNKLVILWQPQQKKEKANQEKNNSGAPEANPPKKTKPSKKRNPWFFYPSFEYKSTEP